MILICVLETRQAGCQQLLSVPEGITTDIPGTFAMPDWPRKSQNRDRASDRPRAIAMLQQDGETSRDAGTIQPRGTCSTPAEAGCGPGFFDRHTTWRNIIGTLRGRSMKMPAGFVERQEMQGRQGETEERAGRAGGSRTSADRRIDRPASRAAIRSRFSCQDRFR